MAERRTLWTALLLATTLPLLASAASAEQGPHGAMAMAEQQARFATLLPETDVTKPPAGFDPIVWASIVPKDNAQTPERVALGKKLYFDTRLSRDGTVACATCHDVSRGFTDRRNVSEGIDDKLGRRNAPTTLNALFFQTMFLDGRVPTLEDQAKLPPVNPVEMGQPDGAAVVKAIAGDPQYVEMFQKAYGRAPNYDDVGRAIAAFERTFAFLDSPLDRFLAGDPQALSPNAQQGWILFNGKARCVSCHQISGANPLGSDNRFHNIGVSARHQDFEKLATQAQKALEGKEGKGATDVIDKLALETDLSELGRFLVTRNRSDIGSFKTLQLRNIGITAPYMHDGSLQTLWDVMDHYNKGGEANPYLDGGIEPLALSEGEIDQLVELMFAMTDRRFGDDNAREMTRQREAATAKRPFRDEALATRKVFPFEQRLQKEK
ncbi:MAG TPA: cytochrome c peroxidase [Candidatus Eisenbacteria bacterium]|nr:cytochrome c peroxidase [Candidatus Eisenbacteria bacterium]